LPAVLDEVGGIDGMMVASNTTEQLEAVGQLGSPMEMLGELCAIAEQLPGTIDLATLAVRMSQACVDSFGADLAWLGWPEPGGGVSVIGGYPQGHPYLVDLSVRWDATPGGGGPVGRAIGTRAPVLIEDVSSNDGFAPWRERAVSMGFRTAATFPLGSEGEAVGCLAIYSRVSGYFDPVRLRLFQAFAHLATAAFTNATLHAAVREYASSLEARVSERTADLAAANAELDRFARSVAHDLRAPLRTIQGLSTAVAVDSEEALSPEARALLTRVVGTADRMSRQIEDLLAYARIRREDQVLRPVSLPRLLEETLASLEEMVQGSGAEVAVVAPLPAVIAHRSALQQVMLNLLHNALKFVEPGQTPRVRVWAEERGAMVRVWVEDQGIGVAPEHQERVFGALERLHGVDAYPGTGLGLAMVREAARRMGGEAGLESVAGMGSRFWVELPSVSDRDDRNRGE
jgi:signal transduction histidine kinase